MSVVFVEATMLRELGAAGKDDACVDLQNDVRGSGIVGRTVPLILERLPGKYFLNAQSLLTRRLTQKRDHAWGEVGVGEPYQRTIVGNVKGVWRAEQSGGLAAAYRDLLTHIDRRLAMLGADNDQC